jgi:hypothetical protein
MRNLCCLLLAAGAAFGQIDAETITVVSRSSTAPAGPDTVTYDLNVTAVVGRGLDEVLKALAGVGVTERDLMGVSSGASRCDPLLGRCSPALSWGFRFSSPIAKLPDTLKALAGPAPDGMTVSYSASSGGLAASPECAYPTLISQARRHAESLAAAAGVRVGRVTALSDAMDEQTSAAFSFVRVGDFSQFIPATGFASFLLGQAPPYIPPPACAVAVQFQLLR